MSNELWHHGILGMKWGVRRFQNKDGSLTETGKKRVAKYEKKMDDYQKKSIKSFESSKQLAKEYREKNSLSRGQFDYEIATGMYENGLKNKAKAERFRDYLNKLTNSNKYKLIKDLDTAYVDAGKDFVELIGSAKIETILSGYSGKYGIRK